MEFLSAIPIVGEPLAIIIPFLVVLGVVVFVHEYGHYIVGRWCGIRAEVVSIGFGPRLFGWRDKRGTEWQVAALPLGGYVRFVGDMDPASAGRIEDSHLSVADQRQAFHNAKLWARTLTVAAGPVFNFALSFVLFFALAFSVGRESADPVIGTVQEDAPETVEFMPGDRVLSIDGAPVETFTDIRRTIQAANGAPVDALVLRDGDEITVSVAYHMAAQVETVAPGYPASRSGMLPGDEIVSVNGAPVGSFRDIQLATADLPIDELITIVAEREGETITFEIEPAAVERPHPVTGDRVVQPTLGITARGIRGIEPTTEPPSVGEAFTTGYTNVWRITTNTVTYLGDLIFAKADPSQLGGPIRIAQVSGERAERGLNEFVHLIAFLSTSIGLLNLFPIPILDGGHLMFYAAEAVRGRPVGSAAIKYGSLIGLSLVLMLMVFATYNDILRL
ncbi:MAG: RIP metalloprotease RseP [Pseudomonadota bacterium]